MSTDSTTSARLIVGVDGSPSSNEALRWAADEAKLRGAELHAVTAFTSAVGFGDVWLITDMTEQEKATEKAMNETIDTVLAGRDVAVHRHLVQGQPASALLDLATATDIIVVGSHGHGGFVGSLLGSVSQRVAAHAPCPVVIVRGDGAEH
jgi:nucleotide-binding universal stress UspA family protein